MSFRRGSSASRRHANEKLTLSAHPNPDAKGIDIKKMTRADLVREAQSDAQRESLLTNGGFTFEMSDPDAGVGAVKPVTVLFALEQASYTYAGQDVPISNSPNAEPQAGSARTGLTVEKPTAEEKRGSQVVVTSVGHTFESMTKNDLRVTEDTDYTGDDDLMINKDTVEVGPLVSRFRPDMADAPNVLRAAAQDKYTALMARDRADLLPTEQRTLEVLRPIVEAMDASQGLPGGYDSEWMLQGVSRFELPIREHEAEIARDVATQEAAARRQAEATARIEARNAEVIRRYEELRTKEQTNEGLDPTEAREMRRLRAEYFRTQGNEKMVAIARIAEAKDTYGTIPRPAQTMMREAGGFLVRNGKDGEGGPNSRAGAVVIEPVMQGETQTGWRVVAIENTTLVQVGQELPIDLSTNPAHRTLLNTILQYDQFVGQREADGFPRGRYIQQIGEGARRAVQASLDKKAADRKAADARRAGRPPGQAAK